MSEITASDRDFLYSQLVKLGDMIGDGLHLEPHGKWIEKEYHRTCVALGLIEKKPRDNAKVDDFMRGRTDSVKCDCGGVLKQTRSGAFIAKCKKCGAKYRLGGNKR